MLADEHHVPHFPPLDLPTDLKRENEYGTLTSREYLYKVQSRHNKPLPDSKTDTPIYLISLMTYLNFLFLIIRGHIHDFFDDMTDLFKHTAEPYREHDKLAPWYSKFESFYTRNMKLLLDDCFSRPTTGVPGRYIRCIERIPHNLNSYFTYTGNDQVCLNLSSYNYLGFAQSEGQCTDAALQSIDDYGVFTTGPRAQLGTTKLHVEVEQLVAEFVGKESAVVFSMGYGTNANFFNAFLDPQCLVISDELNHTSIRTGVRLSGATVRTFKHGNTTQLEKIVREQIVFGQSKTNRPWKKILICVEGLFSMEGTTCNLPELIRLKKKYKCYLFVDEAHSIGAMGPHGKGVCDMFGCDPKDVDILMGTFTKSFGAAGGYIAGEKSVIDRLRLTLTTPTYSEPMPAPVLAQVLSSLKTIEGKLNPGEGEERLQRIAFNSRYLRLGLKRLGFIVYGIPDSPVVPLLLYVPAKMPAFSRMMLQRNIAVVVVGYPATPLIESRIRFCMSASLTKEDIDYVLRHVSEVGDILGLKLGTGKSSPDGKPLRWNVEDVIRETPRDCKEDKYFAELDNNTTLHNIT